MKIFQKKVNHPGIALLVWLGIGVLLSQYGITGGSLLIFDMLAGVVIYRIVTTS